MTIKTTQLSIPGHHPDWLAYIDGMEEDGPQGWGWTEEGAIENLKDEME